MMMRRSDFNITKILEFDTVHAEISYARLKQNLNPQDSVDIYILQIEGYVID